MYDRDMPLLRAHALASPAGLTDIVAFVLCTIRQPLQSVARQMDDVRANGAKARSFFGAKADGYRYAQEHAEVLFAAVSKAVEVNDPVGAIDVLTNIPGLGIVKAAFVAQIVGLEVACLDSHNLARLGLPEAAFKMPKGLKHETRRAKIAAYVQACTEAGGSRYFWDSWCEYVAGNRANRALTTADMVSAYHVECVLCPVAA